jgi:hypothetical protein
MTATVNTEHPEYKRMKSQWKKARDCASGQKAMHEAGTTYLPKLKGQDEEEYKAYKTRTQFFNASWRTIEAMVGMLNRKQPEIKVPASVEPLLENVTSSGKDINTFIQQVVTDIMTTGRIGILVDYPQQKTEGLTKADAEKLNLMPSLNLYFTENIINWKTQLINNQLTLTLLVLTEQASLSSIDEFEHKTETHYRVLDMISANVGEETRLIYRVRVFKVDEKGREQILVSGPDYPMMNGNFLEYIPFVCIGVDDITMDINEPPLIDLFDANIAHYMLDADLKNGLHFTGLPTAMFWGYTPEPNEKMIIGSMNGLCFPDPAGHGEYLEYTGQGLNAVSSEKKEIEQQMAILGARLLTAEKKDAETSQTAQIHRMGENSILANIANTLGQGLTKVKKIFCEWAGAEAGEVLVTINKEFLPAEITPQEITAWVGAQQTGTLSPQVIFWNMQKKEAIPPDLTFEQHQAQIASNPLPGSGETNV